MDQAFPNMRFSHPILICILPHAPPPVSELCHHLVNVGLGQLGSIAVKHAIHFILVELWVQGLVGLIVLLGVGDLWI